MQVLVVFDDEAPPLAQENARKAQEARDDLDAESPSPMNYPVLMASVGIEGDTIAQVANMAVAKENR
jgi:hypothetical protein